MAFGKVFYNRGLWRPHTRTFIIKEEANRFLRPLIVFHKKSTSIKFEGRDWIEQKLTVTKEDKIPDKIVAG